MKRFAWWIEDVGRITARCLGPALKLSGCLIRQVSEDSECILVSDFDAGTSNAYTWACRRNTGVEIND